VSAAFDGTAIGWRARRYRRVPARVRLWFAAALASLCLSPSAASAAVAHVAVRAATPAPEFAAALKPRLLARMAALRVPGAIVLVDIPSVGTWLTALGKADIETGAPMRTDDHMRIGSITKTLTATIVLELVDQGKVGLDDPVSNYLRGVPNGANISVRELLNMTSGLQNFTESLKFNAALDANPERVWAANELLPYAFNPALAVQTHPYFPPNQGFHYSNTNYLLLGEIAEKVTHTPLNVLFKRRIFNPLGMTHSELPKRSDASIPNPHPHGYNFGTNVDGAKAYFAALAGDKANAEVKAAPGTVPHDATRWSTSYTWADGSAISTAGDLLIWAKALGTGRLLSAWVQQQRVAFSPAGNYGLGIEHAPFGGLIGHNGAIPGFQSFMGYAPKTGSTVIVLANLQLGPNVYLGDGLPADELAKIIAQYKPLAGAL